MAKNARELVLDVLNRVEQEGSYSNLLLSSVLKNHSLSPQDRGLVTELVYGTISQKKRLDFSIQSYVKVMKKLDPWVLNLLRLSFYQLMFLERVPSYAVVNEAVNLAKRKGHSGISRLVNGVLRSYLREPEKATIPSKLKGATRIAIKHSHPEWLVERWIETYGEEVTEAICLANNQPAPHSIRVNSLKVTRDDFLRNLNEEGYGKATLSHLSPQGIRIESGGILLNSKWYSEGLFTIQDESSMLVGHLMKPQKGMRVLDVCAAPGGKTTHLAELIKDEGEVIANDLHPHKEKLISEQALRLGIQSIKTVVGDGLTLSERVTGKFDRILLDAPCSGFGVIRRKPDLKWRKSPEDIISIAQIQFQLLKAVAPLLKPGGKLIYSTCTIEPEENQRLIERFLREEEGFQLDSTLVDDMPNEDLRQKMNQPGMIQILPQDWGTDGFFIARLIHK